MICLPNIITSQFEDIFEYSKEVKQKTAIKALDLKNGFIAVNQKDYINNKLKSEIEYITNKENAKKIIFIRNKITDESISCKNMPKMYKREIFEELRNKLLYCIDFDKYQIKKPYSYLKLNKENNLDNIVLLNYNQKKKIITNSNGNMVPTALYFDSFSQNITDEYYDINKVSTILRLRSDIEFLYFDNDKKQITRQEVAFENDKKKVITMIIPFIWKPTDVDFKRYIDFYYNMKNMDGYKQEFINCNSFIINEIFGLMCAKKRIKH